MDVRQMQALTRLMGTVVRSVLPDRPARPYSLNLTLTQACDGACATCGVWRRAPQPGGELSAEGFAKAAAGLAEHILWLGLSGGEPTLRADFAEVLDRVAAVLPRLVLVKIHTNGLNPERVVRRVAESLKTPVPFYLGMISLDGLGATHDRLRGVPGGFNRALASAEGLRGLERRHPHFRLAFETTISRGNREELLGLREFLTTRFPGTPQVFTLAAESFVVGREAPESLFVGPDDLPFIRRLAGAYRLRRPYDLVPKAYLGLVSRYLSGGRSPIKCRAGRDVVTLDSRGELRSCDFQEEPLGRLEDFGGDLARMLDDPALRRRVEAEAGCRSCFSPCAAFPSLLAAPHYVLLGLLTAFLVPGGDGGGGAAR